MTRRQTLQAVQGMVASMLCICPYHPGNTADQLHVLLQVTGTGTGAGKTPITGTQVYTVDNILTQGQSGDLDFPTSGDGRWGIEWEYVSCPSDSS